MATSQKSPIIAYHPFREHSEVLTNCPQGNQPTRSGLALTPSILLEYLVFRYASTSQVLVLVHRLREFRRILVQNPKVRLCIQHLRLRLLLRRSRPAQFPSSLQPD